MRKSLLYQSKQLLNLLIDYLRCKLYTHRHLLCDIRTIRCVIFTYLVFNYKLLSSCDTLVQSHVLNYTSLSNGKKVCWLILTFICISQVISHILSICTVRIKCELKIEKKFSVNKTDIRCILNTNLKLCFP